MIHGPDLYTSAHDLPHALMDVADSWARARSKSPRTKVGAALYCQVSGMLVLGYNGLPCGMMDLKSTWDNQDPHDPLNLYNLVQHAEMNCIRKAWLCGGLIDFSHAILCVTTYPCHHCMKDFIVPSGVKRVIFRDFHRLHDHTQPQPTEDLARHSKITLEKLA